MPNYQFKVKDLNGKTRRGQMEGADERQVYAALRSQNEYLLWCRETEEKENYKALSSKELSEFANQLGTMLAAGISLSRTLYIIAQRAQSKRQQGVYTHLYTLVNQGILLSDAMERQGRALPVLMINMVRAGESSGQMDDIAMKMAKHYEKDSRLQAKVKSAMAYPIFLLCLIVAVIMIIFVVVLPQFNGLFDDMGDNLGWNTRLLIALSRYMTHHWYIVLLCMGMIGVLLVMLFQSSGVRRLLDRAKLRMPILSGIYQTLYTARFARGLSSLYSSGLSMLQALQICKGLIGNTYMEEQFDTMITDVKNGVSLSKTMNKSKGWDSKLIASIYVGEESGRINEILDTLADSFDYEAQQATQRLIGILEPVMIICIAVIVGYVVMSVMMPILQYYQSMSH